MPVISRFYGIVIRMLVAQSFTARFHAIYGDTELIVALDPVRIVNGDAPARMRDMVLEWATEHESELLTAWNQLVSAKQPMVVAPLE
jgi:aryl carrier-like protein